MSNAIHQHEGLPQMQLHDPQHGVSRQRVVRNAWRLALLALGVLLLGLAHALYARWDNDRDLAAKARENATLHVHVMHADTASKEAALTLPGTLQGRQETQLYARASGYVKTWLKDIGDPVKKGELLATLDTPEVARQVDEARANYLLTKTAFERWTRLRTEDAVPQQELDEKTSAFHQAEAELKRTQELLNYGEVRAPFDGIVTRRNINLGDLVNTGPSSQPLFALAQIDKLHAYVYVPQAIANHIHVGDTVNLIPPDHPDQKLKARVARTAGAIDQSTRTLQVDVEIANADHKLLPGSYVDIAIQAGQSRHLLLPTNTLLFDAKGPQVALVKNGKVVRQPVTLGTDFGKEVEITSGLTADDVVIINPPDSIHTGTAVKVEESAKASQTAAKT